MGSRRNPHKHTHAAPGDNITTDTPPAKGRQYGCQSQLHVHTEARGEGDVGGGQGEGPGAKYANRACRAFPVLILGVRDSRVLHLSLPVL